MNVLLALAPLAIGAALAGFGTAETRRSHRFRRAAIRTTAIVVDIERYVTNRPDWAGGQRGAASSTNYNYEVRVRFLTRHGATVETSVDAGNRPPKRSETIRVLYNPSQPADARLDTLTGRGSCGAIIMLIFGMIFFVGGIVGLINSLSS